ncbi:MAG: AbrB/MazE/SpoVT family DNA-binding domain-containing protein [Geminicoccaceae bacterium]
MNVQVTRWGNSLGVRLPKALASQFGIVEGARVQITAEGDGLVIRKLKRRYSLEELLEGTTPEAMSEAFDWGEDKGREIVE